MVKLAATFDAFTLVFIWSSWCFFINKHKIIFTCAGLIYYQLKAFLLKRGYSPVCACAGGLFMSRLLYRVQAPGIQCSRALRVLC